MRRMRRRPAYPLIQRLVYRQFQVDDRTASLADEMVVRAGIGVETIEGAAEIDLLDQPLFHQDVEISVNRTHAEVREIPLQPFVDPVRRGVSPGTLHKLENSLSLPASLVLAVRFDRRTTS